MGNTFGPPFGLPDRATPLPNRGYSTVACQVPDDEKLPHQLYPWIFPPPGYESFDLTGAIATPAVSVTPSTVVTLNVPQGWDGVVLRIANVFIGTGFQEASGDLTWGIFINGNQPVRNYGQIITTFGSVAYPREISGFIVRAGQSVVYNVINANAALTGGTFIYCTLSGYFWRSQGGTY